jgi:iron(III) transport system substrate-binding protein
MTHATHHCRRGHRGWIAILLVLAVTALASCQPRAPEVVAYTSVDQVFSEPIFRLFEETTGIRVRAVFDTEETKSTGIVNRLIAEATSPQADVFWSGDPVRPFLLIHRGLVEPYVSPEAAGIPDAFKAADGTWTGFAARARVLLVNKAGIGSRPIPASVRDLADPGWKAQTAMANPLFGTTTIHAAALFAVMGDEQARAFFAALRSNEVRLASSNGEVKRLVASGEVAFGLTDTDDASEAIRGRGDLEAVYPDRDGLGTLVLPTAVVLVARSPNANAGRRLIDFLLSAEVERRLALSGAHMPLRTGVPVPPGVKPLAEVHAMSVDYAKLGDVMEQIQPWLRGWVGL